MDTPTTAIKSKLLTLSEMLNIINRGDGVQNVPYTPNDEEQVIPVKNVHDKLFLLWYIIIYKMQVLD
jgi:hypothetical protein